MQGHHGALLNAAARLVADGARPARRILIAALIALWVCLAPVAAAAMIPSAPAPQEPAAEAPEPAIEAEQAAGSDERIAERITGIFSELPSLSRVRASVEEGVVTLSGEVDSAEAAKRAEAIAARVQGVVTIENGIERDVSVDSGLGLVQLEERLNGAVKLLPLIGAALLVALVIIAIGYLIASLTGIWHRLAPNGFLAELIASAIRFVFIIGGLLVALNIIGAGTLLGAVLGGAGVIGIALGFAMRDTIENYVASLMLSLRQPFRPNDWVLIEEHEGRVIRLTSRATILMTLDGNHLRIPNSTVFKAVILNYTRNPQRRFEFDLGIDADDDALAARELGRRTLAALPFVLAEPPPEGRIIEVGDSNIIIRFLAWIDQKEADWFKAQSRAIPAVKVALEEAGFAIPEPIYRLRFDQRTGPLPFENIAGSAREEEGGGTQTAARPPERSIRRESPAPETHEDVSPQNEVARMVDDERAGTGEKDLLDPARPVE